MEKRQLGNSGIEVLPLCLGGNIFGWTIDEATSFQILDAFTAAGFDFIDTADIYSRWAAGHTGGESETILGNWFKQRGNRSNVVLATKVGMDMGDGKIGLSKKYILAAVEDSLRRLQTDYIDLYQSHKDDLNTPLDETLEAYAELIQSGKVRAIGASNYTSERLSESIAVSQQHGLPSYQALQPHYNLAYREDYESTLEPLILKYNIGVIPYYSLAAGFLTGKYRSEADLSKSPRGQGAKKYLNERGFRILAALDSAAKASETTPAVIALAWLMARPGITAPIASATSLKQLESLVASAQITLNETTIKGLNEASA